MARYTDSSYRVSRRLGFSTLETGRELAKKPYAPGVHGSKKAKKLSNYGGCKRYKAKRKQSFRLSQL